MKPDQTSWYFMPNYKDRMQTWVDPHPAWYSREFPTGWYKIDSDEEPTDFDAGDLWGEFEQNIIRGT